MNSIHYGVDRLWRYCRRFVHPDDSQYRANLRNVGGPATVLTAYSQFLSDAAPSRVDALSVVIFFVPVVPQYRPLVYFSN